MLISICKEVLTSFQRFWDFFMRIQQNTNRFSLEFQRKFSLTFWWLFSKCPLKNPSKYLYLTQEEYFDTLQPRTFSEQTGSAVALLNLSEFLTVNSFYRFHALRCTHLWHRNLLPNVFYVFFSNYMASVFRHV